MLLVIICILMLMTWEFIQPCLCSPIASIVYSGKGTMSWRNWLLSWVELILPVLDPSVNLFHLALPWVACKHLQMWPQNQTKRKLEWGEERLEWVRKALALCAEILGSVIGTAYGPPDSARSDPWVRARNKPSLYSWMWSNWLTSISIGVIKCFIII